MCGCRHTDGCMWVGCVGVGVFYGSKGGCELPPTMTNVSN